MQGGFEEGNMQIADDEQLGEETAQIKSDTLCSYGCLLLDSCAETVEGGSWIKYDRVLLESRFRLIVNIFLIISIYFLIIKHKIFIDYKWTKIYHLFFCSDISMSFL